MERKEKKQATGEVLDTDRDTDRVLLLASYNITASYLSDKEIDGNKPHAWSVRREAMMTTLRGIGAAVVALQELAVDQALDLIDMLPEQRFLIFQQRWLRYSVPDRTEVCAGRIFTSRSELEPLANAFCGTAMIGIMYDPRQVELLNTGMFFYKAQPYSTPRFNDVPDHPSTDQGFGNVNSPRGPGFARFLHKGSGKQFFFFTFSAPLCGGSPARNQCFALERQIIAELTGTGTGTGTGKTAAPAPAPALSTPFFSVGDRNMLPADGFQENYDTLFNTQHGQVYDWKHPVKHEGCETTWLGYLYEPRRCQNTMDTTTGNFRFTARLDIGIASVPPLSSAHHHCFIRDKGYVDLLGALRPGDNEARTFLSAHSLLTARFLLS